MKLVYTLLSLTILLLGNAASASQSIKVTEGTEVSLELLEPLSSATAVQGQRFNLELDQDLKINGVMVAPAGSKAIGSVVSARKRGFMGKAGELNIQVDYFLVGDQRVKLRASSGREGEGRVGSTVALTVLFGPIGLLKRGKDIEVPKGQIITAFVDQTAEVPVTNAVSAPAPLPATSDAAAPPQG